MDFWERSLRLRTSIRHEIYLGKFDPEDYIKRELQSLKFENYVEAWLERRKREQASRQISKSYFNITREYVRPYFNRDYAADVAAAAKNLVLHLPSRRNT